MARNFFGVEAMVGAQARLKDKAKGVLERSAAANATPIGADQKTPDEAARAILMKNPGMPATAFLSSLAAHGLTIAAKESSGKEADPGPLASPYFAWFRKVAGKINPKRQLEADSGTAFTQVLLPAAKLKGTRRALEAEHLTGLTMRESSPRDDGIGYTRFDCTLIEEGLGNLDTCFYYTREALESLIPLLEGRQAFADHPSKDEEETRPERSIRDLMGKYEGLKIVEQAGRAKVDGDLCIFPDKEYEWARGLCRESIEHAKKYPDQPLMGLSINAGGDAIAMSFQELLASGLVPDAARPKIQAAIAKGLTDVKVVTGFTKAKSCDAVTKAGAGGRINGFKSN